MARLRSTTFQGTSAFEVDPDAFTFTETLQNAIADTNLVDDILDGDNSPPADSKIDHRGYDSGSSRWRGCPLGLPLGNMLQPKSAAAHSLAAPSTTGWSYVLMAPFYCPRGESYVDICFRCDYPGLVSVLVFNTSLVAVGGESAFQGTAVALGFPANVRRARVTGLTGGTEYILAVALDTSSLVSESTIIQDLSVHFGRRAGAAVPLLLPPDYTTSGFAVPTTTSSGATIPNPTNLDDAFCADDLALTSQHVSACNRNQNAVEEYMTGAPCAGNTARALVDSGSTDPTVSAFHDHSQGGKSNEPLADVPLWLECFGGVIFDGSDAGFPDWNPPGLKVSTKSTFCESIIWAPDNPESAGTSRLQVMVLCCSPIDAGVAAVDVEVQCFNTSGVSAGAVTAAFSRIGTTKFFRVTATGIAFYADERNLLRIAMDWTSGSAIKAGGTSWFVLGASAALRAP